MTSESITLWFDGRIPIEVDREEFAIIKMMIEDAGAVNDRKAMIGVINDLESQGYQRHRAMNLCIMAIRELDGSRTPTC